MVCGYGYAVRLDADEVAGHGVATAVELHQIAEIVQIARHDGVIRAK